jgi:hypothetical protein
MAKGGSARRSYCADRAALAFGRAPKDWLSEYLADCTSAVAKLVSPHFGTYLRMTRKTKISVTAISPVHFSAIGLVASNWATLEAVVTSAIWQIGEIPDEIGACVTSQIYTFDGRMKALLSILEIRGELDKTIKSLKKFHESTRGLGEFRNRVLHDPWIHDAESNTPHRLEITANKKLVLGYEAVPTQKLIEKAKEIEALIHQFRQIIRPAIDRFPPLPRSTLLS